MTTSFIYLVICKDMFFPLGKIRYKQVIRLSRSHHSVEILQAEEHCLNIIYQKKKKKKKK